MTLTLVALLLAQVVNDPITDLLNQLSRATPFEAWQIVAGAALPWFAGWLIRQHWDPARKSWVALGAATVVAVGGSYLSGEFTLTLTLAAVIKVATIAWGTYIGFWKPTGLAPNVSDAERT